MVNNSNTLKMLVFIALATVMAGAVAATIIPAQQADAEPPCCKAAKQCPSSSPGYPRFINPGSEPPHGCGP